MATRSALAAETTVSSKECLDAVEALGLVPHQLQLQLQALKPNYSLKGNSAVESRH